MKQHTQQNPVPRQAATQQTHVAVPVVVFQAVVKTLEGLPFAQVSPVMSALQQCPGLVIRPDAKPGQTLSVVPPQKATGG